MEVYDKQIHFPEHGVKAHFHGTIVKEITYRYAARFITFMGSVFSGLYKIVTLNTTPKIVFNRSPDNSFHITTRTEWFLMLYVNVQLPASVHIESLSTESGYSSHVNGTLERNKSGQRTRTTNQATQLTYDDKFIKVKSTQTFTTAIDQHLQVNVTSSVNVSSQTPDLKQNQYRKFQEQTNDDTKQTGTEDYIYLLDVIEMTADSKYFLRRCLGSSLTQDEMAVLKKKVINDMLADKILHDHDELQYTSDNTQYGDGSAIKSSLAKQQIGNTCKSTLANTAQYCAYNNVTGSKMYPVFCIFEEQEANFSSSSDYEDVASLIDNSVNVNACKSATEATLLYSPHNSVAESSMDIRSSIQDYEVIASSNVVSEEEKIFKSFQFYSDKPICAANDFSEKTVDKSKKKDNIRWHSTNQRPSFNDVFIFKGHKTKNSKPKRHNRHDTPFAYSYLEKEIFAYCNLTLDHRLTVEDFFHAKEFASRASVIWPSLHPLVPHKVRHLD